MGIDVYGILFYGIPITDEDIASQLTYHSFEDEEGNPVLGEDGEQIEGEWDELYKLKTGDYPPSGLPFSVHKIDTNNTVVLAVDNSYKSAWWAELIEIKSLEIGPEWNKQLQDFCEIMGIPWQEPKWYLTSNMSS